VDLFEPGSGLTVQLHDYQPGIAPSGLFWTVPMPDAAFSRQGHTARYKATDLPVLDSFVIFGPDEVPGLVTFDMTFVASGPMRHLRPGSFDPTDPTAFAAELRDATTTGSFSGSSVTELGGDPFSFSGTATGIWGELGKERNGHYLGHGGPGRLEHP
jgi:hypothetical protein